MAKKKKKSLPHHYKYLFSLKGWQLLYGMPSKDHEAQNRKSTGPGSLSTTSDVPRGKEITCGVVPIALAGLKCDEKSGL